MAKWRGHSLKEWGGKDAQAFLDALALEMDRDGYVLDSPDKKSPGSLRFCREPIPGYSCVVSVLPLPHRQRPPCFGFDPWLSVSSSRQRDVYNALALWECFNRHPIQARAPLGEAADDVVLISRKMLYFLPEPSVDPWHGIAPDDFMRALEQFLGALQTGGERWFASLATPDGLLSGLLSEANLRRSERAHEHAAVLLHDAGQPVLALARIEAHLQHIDEQFRRDVIDADARRIEREIVGRYRQWMRSN